jgi:hypothetical protein
VSTHSWLPGKVIDLLDGRAETANIIQDEIKTRIIRNPPHRVLQERGGS